MAALTTFMDPSHPAAELKWWEDATRPRAASRVIERLADWTRRHMLRREKDVIAHLLPDKTITKHAIHGSPGEVYDTYEKSIIQALKQVHKLSGGENKKELQGMYRF